jgi:hypothetical protein
LTVSVERRRKEEKRKKEENIKEGIGINIFCIVDKHSYEKCVCCMLNIYKITKGLH